VYANASEMPATDSVESVESVERSETIYMDALEMPDRFDSFSQTARDIFHDINYESPKKAQATICERSSDNSANIYVSPTPPPTQTEDDSQAQQIEFLAVERLLYEQPDKEMFNSRNNVRKSMPTKFWRAL
jgi:hypothetical protein